ncbi:hypothetical protein CEXT_410281 [Caerostris extrusa]|uniref:Uncharacterized protein n=1 Tax=Caerostris extrusa TaxID=172846 RepID=A0AAV4UM67_CAEEX|nr:hypothetical protein CEXT_410281 [Caerostris extrusa]
MRTRGENTPTQKHPCLKQAISFIMVENWRLSVDLKVPKSLTDPSVDLKVPKSLTGEVSSTIHLKEDNLPDCCSSRCLNASPQVKHVVNNTEITCPRGPMVGQ